MTYSSLLTTLWRSRDPKWLWPWAGMVSVLVHGLIFAMVRSLTLDVADTSALDSNPLPIQLVALPPPDSAEPALTSNPTAPSAAPEDAPTEPGSALGDVSPSPMPSLPPTISPRPRRPAPLPEAEMSAPANVPRPSNAPEGSVDPPSSSPAPTVSPPPGREAPAMRPVPQSNRPGNPQVLPPPQGRNPQPPMVEPALPAAPGPTPTVAPETRVETPPLVDSESRPPAINPGLQPSPQGPGVIPPPSPGSPPANPTPAITEPPGVEPPAENPGNTGQGGQLTTTNVRLNPLGRDIPEVAPQIQGGSRIAVQPLPPQCAVSNLATLGVTNLAATVQLQVRVEANGQISMAEVVPGNGSGNAAVDNLVRCLVTERLTLVPAASGGQPIKTDAFILETRISF